jgi:DNA topoisomerase-3
MGKALIIAEKPSVAGDIAKALGGFQKHDEYFESENYVLSSAIGHLLELCVPEQFEVKKGKWTFAALPMIPPHFDLRPIEKSEARLKVLAKLIKRKDVDALINACDAGREGELIFRNIVQHTRAKQPIKRLWLQSMTPAAIRDGFAALRADSEVKPLADAAVCRSESDWLVGINGTRAMTAFNSKLGGFQLTTVGRVQTPTLVILVEREERIKKFVERKYWEIIGTFQAKAGEYTGRWFDEAFEKAKDRKDADTELKAERVWDLAKAEALRDKCLGQPGIVTEESKPTTSLSPLLYDLTSLQREANSRFGFSAKNTLGLAQALYEKHKVLTYPRTDSRALPEDYGHTVKQTLGMLQGTGYRPFADEILNSDWVKPGNKRIFNNAKISDHFAIIPTSLAPKHLSEPEQKLYDLVTKRFLAVFFPAAEFLVTTRITRVESEPFKSEGKVMLKAGWMAVYGREVEDDATPNLAPIEPDETVQTTKIDVNENVTKPPPRFTEATLLSAMEGAGKLVEDEELRAAMKEKGLGTPATRASIIEGLITEKYIHRLHKELQPTAKAFSLITLLRGLDIPELCKPELTGNWEHKLRLMARGQMQRADFMREIAAMTRHIVERAKGYESDTVPGDFGELKTPCPKCGSVVKENYRKFQCTNQGCDFGLWKSAAGRLFEAHEIDELLERKQVGPLQGFRSKQGFPFAAIVKLTPEFKAEFDFGQNKDAEGAPAEVDFTGKEPVGQCPKCKSRVFENGMSYVCEKSVGAMRNCDFRSGTIILQQPIERAQMAKLLTDGKTDLLQKFISKKNGRPFKAFLVLGKDGKIGFEFEPRAPKGKGAAKDGQPAAPAPKLDFTGQEPLGVCPKCKGKIFQSPEAYVCENGQREMKRCTFKLDKIKNGRPIDVAQLQKLLKDGRTDMLDHFISRAGKPFSAHLVLESKGKVGFEFAPRESDT